MVSSSTLPHSEAAGVGPYNVWQRQSANEKLNFMKTKTIAGLFAALALGSLCIVQSGSSAPKSDKPSAPTLEQVHSQMQKLEMELHQGLARIATLEEQVRELRAEVKVRADTQQALPRITALEAQVKALLEANAKLQKAIGPYGQYRLIPLESK